MDGFTGIDVNRAQSEIENFLHSAFQVLDNYRTTVKDLFDVLSSKWASPIAVEFSNIKIPKLDNLCSQYHTAILHIIHGACDAANQLATANGVNGFSNFFGSVTAGYTNPSTLDIQACKETINGVTGMDAENVKLAVDLFSANSTKILSMLDSVPKGIAFYDPNGQLLNTYNRGITDFIQVFTDLLTGIENELRGYIETEHDNILLAKQQATDTMRA